MRKMGKINNFPFAIIGAAIPLRRGIAVGAQVNVLEEA